LAALARSRGFAVGIGHVTRLATLEALRDTLPELIAAGIRVVPLKELY
jgi:polysaccharide deacetylase 2 family uncharacterized protein YibQ